MCEAINQMRNQIIEAKRETANLKRETADLKRETAYANCKAHAFEAYLRKLGVSEEEIKAIGSGKRS